MADRQVDPPVPAKRKKKSKKKKGAKVELGAVTNGEMENTPKQTSAADDEVITTSKCQRCKGLFKLMVSRSEVLSVSQSTTWVCQNCLQIIRSEDQRAPPPAVVKTQKEPANVSSGSGGCNCSACITKRENVITPESERDAQTTQTYWMDVRHVVRRIYRDNMNLSSQESRSIIGSDKMVAIVKILCAKDPHQFFQRLETLAREYLLEVKVRLLEQLSCGFNSPQLAIEFVQMLLDEYSIMCASLPSLLYLLEPLEDGDFIPKLGVTIELMNKNIFRELIFAESFMSLNLPLIVAQLRLACLSSDPYHRSTADALSHRYLSLDREMEEENRIWRSAKDRLNGHTQGEEEKRSHIWRLRQKQKWPSKGLTPEEVVEVALKLNALKALGINLRIEDLFDEEGLLLAENQDLLSGGGGGAGEESVGDDVYFLDD